MENDSTEKDISNDNTTNEETSSIEPITPGEQNAQQQQHLHHQHHHHSQQQQQLRQHPNDYEDLTMSLISNNDVDMSLDHDIKIKQRRYWLPKEEERFFQIWGRDNWRLTKHGKNTIFFAQWSDELRDKYNIDVKLEEIQCKVNQTRAKFRQVKKQLETSKNVTLWKKYHIVEKILKNQYRSKDDEPIPPEALENNRDLSPTELLNTGSTSPSTSVTSTTAHEPNLNQISGGGIDHPSQSRDVNTSNIMVNDSNITMTNYTNELFNDDIDIKAEIEEDLRKEEEFINEYNHHSNSNYANYQTTEYGQHQTQSAELMPLHGEQQPQQQQYQQPYVNQMPDNHHPPPPLPPGAAPTTALPSLEQAQNYSNHLTTNTDPTSNHGIGGGSGNSMNYNSNALRMHPPRIIGTNTTTAIMSATRRRNQRSHIGISNMNSNTQQNGVIAMDNLETMYMEEVRRKNAILTEQSSISRKRLALEQRKINLMEEFFPKYLKLQEQILEKIGCKVPTETVHATETATTITTPEDSSDIQINE